MRECTSMRGNEILRKLGTIALATFVVTVSFYAGLYANAQKLTFSFTSADGKATAEATDMSLFWKARDILDSKFVTSATSTATSTEQDKLYGAIKGLAESYGDPYTTFLSPKEAKSLTGDLSGSLDGIGTVLGLKDKMLNVVSVIKDSPAEKAGLRSGDLILKIGDKSTVDIDVDTAVSLIRGKKGTSVTLTIARQGNENRDVTIVRDTINVPVVESTKYPGGVYLIKVSSFTSNLQDLFRDAVRDYVNSGYSHMVIDLRNNTGGYLDGAVDMASWFLPAGSTVVIEDFAGKESSTSYRSRGYNVLPNNLKIVILVNEYTASAAEIFAGALKDNHKAILVGAKTYGKGSVQELVPLTDDTLLKVTIARWLTPSGTSISHNGIVPDYVVDISSEDMKAGKDPQLNRALELARYN